MKGTLYENDVPKGEITDFTVTPGKVTYQRVMDELVPVGKENDTATFTSPIGSFNPAKSYEVRCANKVYPIIVNRQNNSKCNAIIENASKEDDETSLP